MMIRPLSFAIAALALLSACGDDSSSTGSQTSTTTTSTTSTTATTSTTGQGGAGTTTGQGGAGGAGTTTGQGGSGTTGQGGGDTIQLTGDVIREVQMVRGDCSGNIYIGVFAENPVLNMSAQPLGNAVVMDARLNIVGDKVPYLIPDVPVTGNDGFVIAFLDDNDTVTAENSRPDSGDPVSLTGFMPIRVSLATAGTVNKDLPLTLLFP